MRTPPTIGPLAESLGVPPHDLLAAVAALRRRGWTMAAAESLTGGLLTALLTEVPGSSEVVRGGLVVYATDLKHRLAGVDADVLARVGPVHPEVARQLARGARERCGADVGVGLTGVAGPDPQHGIAVGTVFVACTSPAGEELSALTPSPSPVTRSRVRVEAVIAALILLRSAAEMTG